MTAGTAFGPGIDDDVGAPLQTQRKPARKRDTATKPKVDPPITQPTAAAPAQPKQIVMEDDCILDLVLGNMMTLHVGQRVTDPQIIALVLERKLPYREV
jgi:hypothetical protein